MKHALGWLAHVACLASILLAVWVPFGGRGQWIATAVVLLLVGAMLLGSVEKPAPEPETEWQPETTRALQTYITEADEGTRPHPTYGTTEEEEDDR